MSSIEDAFRALPSASLDERLELLRMLVEHWYGPIEPGDGYAARDLGTEKMPRALRWWLTTVGSKGIFRQNRLRGRPLGVAENGMLVFLVENQGCFELATPVDGEDPSAWSRDFPANTWTCQDVPLSIALLHMLAVEIVLGAPWSAWSDGDPSAEGDWLAKHCVEAKVPGLKVAPGGPARIFAGADVIAIVFTDGGGWIGAKDERLLDFLKARPDTWERVEREW